MKQPGRHERSKGQRDAEPGRWGFWRAGRPSRKSGPAEAEGDRIGPDRPAGPDLIESWGREQSLSDLPGGRDYVREDDPDSRPHAL